MRNTNLIGKSVFGANPGGTASEVINAQIPLLLFEIPNGITLQQAATTIGGADTAWHAINDVLKVNQADRVLIIGASGGVGQYLLQLSKLRNATIFSIVSEDSSDFAVKLGSDEVIVYDNHLKNQLTKLKSVTKIVDAVGDPNLLNQILEHTGDVDILSLSQTNFNPPKIKQHFQFNNGRIALRDYNQILNLLSNGDLTAHVQQIFPFQQVIEAQKIAKFKHSQGRILLSFN